MFQEQSGSEVVRGIRKICEIVIVRKVPIADAVLEESYLVGLISSIEYFSVSKIDNDDAVLLATLFHHFAKNLNTLTFLKIFFLKIKFCIPFLITTACG